MLTRAAGARMRCRGPTSGRGASLVAAAALIVDYTLTVAVSIAAGVASLTSAFPGLSPETVPICLGILAVVTLLNLRGLAMPRARSCCPRCCSSSGC